MMKVWRVALHEYKRNVLKRSFILVLLSVPLMIGFNVVLGLVMDSLTTNTAPVGYVDQAGLFVDPIPLEGVPASRAVQFNAYSTEDEALAALEAERIQAYYVVAADYFETARIDLKYLEQPGENATSQFYDFVQVNLLRDEPPAVVRLATGDVSIDVRTADGSRYLPGGQIGLGSALPPLIGIAFAFLLIMSSGFIMQAVADEKENRTIEVLVTSVSPAGLIVGKVLGVVAISLTQMVAWGAFAVLGVVLAGRAGIESFQNLSIDWAPVLSTLAVGVPAYLTAAGMMVGIGATVASAQEGQSVGSIFFLLHMLPAYVAMVIVETPNAPLAVALTFAPFTALVTLGMRQVFTTVPLWQIAAAVAVQSAYAAGALWLAGRAFRLGMLRYGKRLSLRELVRRRAS
jgi:ABC-2 type transport system permease protein